MWRRLFWMVYVGDRTRAALEDSLSFIHEDQVAHLSLPTEVDDEDITDEGYLDAGGSVPIMTGHVYHCKLHRRGCRYELSSNAVLGQVLENQRRDLRTPPADLPARQRELLALQNGIEQLMEGCPEPLRLDADESDWTLAWVHRDTLTAGIY